MKKEYEVMFLFDPREAVFRNTLNFVKDILVKSGIEIVFEEDMGVKRLAYLIRKKLEGHYYLMKILAVGSEFDAVRKDFSLNEDILRYMFTKIEKKYFNPKRLERLARKREQLQKEETSKREELVSE